MNNEDQEQRALRAVHTPINSDIYNKVNGARVAAELTWRDVLESALSAWLAENTEVTS